MGKLLYIIQPVPLPLFTLTDTLHKSDPPKPLASKGTNSVRLVSFEVRLVCQHKMCQLDQRRPSFI